MIRCYAATAVLAAATLCLGVGCGQAAKKVQVKVTMDDKPLAGAAVSMTPQSGSGQPAAGVTDDNGICVLRSGTTEGVLPGDYVVTIAKFEAVSGMTGDAMKDMMNQAKVSGSLPKAGAAGPPMPSVGSKGPKNLIPEKYNDAKNSGFTYKVPDDASGVKEFKLSSK